MASIIEGYSYDIFISYRQKDNKYDGWVTTFVDNLKRELEATFKEDISIYFDENPHDGLLETHNVDKSLEGKLKCLVFIPIISQTYCDPKSFAWQHEFCSFNKMAKEDQFGRDIRLTGGNVASRILPVKINDLDPEDKAVLEDELGGVMRAVDFIYKEPGVNRPLTPDDDEKNNLNKTKYRNQINKVANAVKEIIKGLKYPGEKAQTEKSKITETKTIRQKIPWIKITVPAAILTVLLIVGLFILPSVIKKSPGGSSSIGKSIAVLPFDNLSNDPQEYFSVGIVDEILDNLFKVGGLKVIARTSSARFKDTNLSLKEIARELGVATIMEGSIRRDQNNVRITVQLIDARTEAQIWSEIYNKDISDIFSIQSEVAQAVARKLKATITPEARRLIEKKPTNNIDAWNDYLQGRYYWGKLTRQDMDSALLYFVQAKEKDPGFALAYAGIAHVWAGRRQLEISKPSEATPKAEEAIMKALELDSTHSDIYYILGTHLVWGKFDWEGGDKAFKKALEMNPNNAEAHAYYSHLLNIVAQSVLAMEHIETALSLDPKSSLIKALYGIDLLFIHKYDDAVKAFQDALSLDPAQGAAAGNISLALYYAGREEEAFKTMVKVFKNPGVIKAIEEGYAEGGIPGAHKKLADLFVERSKTVPVSAMSLAHLYSIGGDTDNAIIWLEKAIEERNPNSPYVLSPIFDPLRSDPRFQELCSRMKLPYK